jgi:hypothetical protein
MNTQIIKMAVKMIGQDNINASIQAILKMLTEKLHSVQLQPNETKAVIFIYETNGIQYATICTINENQSPPALVRQIEDHKITDLIDLMLKQL